MGRHERRSNAAHFRREAGDGLETFLCPPDDVRLRTAPLLQWTLNDWLDMLPKRARFCIVCSSWLMDRDHVGLVLLAAPATVRKSSASCCSVCRDCADAGLPLEALEKASERVLREALPSGKFEPMGAQR